MTTKTLTDDTSVKGLNWSADESREGRELRTPHTPPPPPNKPRSKESGTQEGPDKRQLRYLTRRALFAFEEADGQYAVLGNYFPKLHRAVHMLNLPLIHEKIIVVLREILAELKECEPMDIPGDDVEHLAMQYLGEITPASALSKDPLSGKDMQELSRRLGAVPESERIQQIRDAISAAQDALSGKDIQELARRLGAVPESERIQQIRDIIGPELNIPGPWPLPETPESQPTTAKPIEPKPRSKFAEIFRWIFSRGKFLGS